MIALSMELTDLSEPLVLAVLIALVLSALEGERIWTRARRRRALGPGALAYLLDGLVIVGIVLTLVSAALLFVDGLTSTASVVGGVIHGERVGLLIVSLALALGLALALVRAASGRRVAQDLAIARAAVMLPTNLGPTADEAHLAVASEQQIDSATPQYERFEAAPQPLSMTQERWRPGATAAASVPTSFLDLKEPPANQPTRSRFALASTLLVLALVVMVVSGALLFRHQLMNILAGMESTYGGVVSASSSAPPSQLGTGAENAAADVGAATSVASVPTAATSLAAPLPASDLQAGQKRVKSNGLNLRAQPGTDQQVVVVLTQGDIVTVFTDARLIQGATWVKVRAGDFEGWVDQSLLE
jgi:hypothetical protein